MAEVSQLKRAKFLLLCWLAALATSGPAYAAETYEFYTGVRQLGMGGAYTGVVNDETALLTNPAGLGKVRDTTFTLVDPEIHGSFNNTKVVKFSNITDVFGVQGLLDALKQQKETHYHAKFQIFPSIVTTNFGLGFHAKYSYDAEVDATGTVYRLDYVSDYAVVLGNSLRFFGGIVKLGYAVRLVDRVEVHKDLDATSTNLELSQIASAGLGLGADIGLIVTAPVVLLPSVSVVVRDVGGTAYTLGDGSRESTADRPETTRQTIDAGISIFPILANKVRMTLTADYHDVLDVAETKDAMSHLHVGSEFNFSDFFFLRAGMNQRYWTAGIELASERFQLQVASYGEEIGTASTPREDRRWVSKFTFRF